MSNYRFQSLYTVLSAFLLLWLGGKYILPLILPFLLGFLLALAAEPAVALLDRHLPFRRGGAAFLGVSVTVLLLSVLITLLLRFLVRELGHLASLLPNLEQSAHRGLSALENWLLGLAMSAPEGLRSLLTRSILGLFDGGSNLYGSMLTRLPVMATGVLSHVPEGFLFFGTGLLSSYLFSARMPRLRAQFHRLLPKNWQDRWVPALTGLRNALIGWGRAQLTLLGLTFLLICGGLLLLKVPLAPLWALVIALVDAVPMLGTGLILLPWSLICFLQGQSLRALGMAALFAAATVLRTTLEPRLLGRHLGLDPLVTLMAMYLGYRLLGFPGLLLSPIFAVTVVQIIKATQEEDKL